MLLVFGCQNGRGVQVSIKQKKEANGSDAHFWVRHSENEDVLVDGGVKVSNVEPTVVKGLIL